MKTPTSMKLPTPMKLPRTLRGDVQAALTTAVMLVPQGMAYAMLAGLPPVVGLYAASLPLLAYASAGSSPPLAVGPVALDSLLTAATIGVIAQSGSKNYVQLAALLALLTGVVQLLLGLLRGGFLVNFLSRPVVSGFTSAAALIIATSQVPVLLGLNLPRSAQVFSSWQAIVSHLADFQPLTFGVSLGMLVLLWAMKRWAERLPRALIVVLFGMLIAGPLGGSLHGIAVLGEVPGGFPPLTFTSWSELSSFWTSGTSVQAAGGLEKALDGGAGTVSFGSTLILGAITIAFVGFMEGLSISSKLAEKGDFEPQPNREFFALGLANLTAGIFSGFPVAGGLSRTAVNAEAGARSKWAGVMTALLVLLVLLLLADALYLVAKVSLAVIIFMAVMPLVDLREARRLYSVKRSDFWLLVATFVGTLTWGIQQGILLGVLLSLGLLVVRTTQPHMARLGRLPGTHEYRNILRFPEAEERDCYLIARLDAQLYFGNVSFLRERLRLMEREQRSELSGVILDATGMNQLDSSAEHALAKLFADYQARKIRFVLAGVKGPVRDVLEQSGLWNQLGNCGVALCVHDAVVKLDGNECDFPGVVARGLRGKIREPGSDRPFALHA